MRCKEVSNDSVKFLESLEGYEIRKAGIDRLDLVLNALRDEGRKFTPEQWAALQKLGNKMDERSALLELAIKVEKRLKCIFRRKEIDGLAKQILDIIHGGDEGASVPISSPLKCEAQKYNDTRFLVAPHPALNFSVIEEREISAADLLKELLGEEDADFLIKELRHYFDSTKCAPGSNKVAFFLDSDKKARDKKSKGLLERTTQEKDFQASGLEFADDLQAIIVCATLVKKAKDAGLDLTKGLLYWKNDQSEAVSKLNEMELVLLGALSTGAVRSRSLDISIQADGRLHACTHSDLSLDYTWAFGGVSSAA